MFYADDRYAEVFRLIRKLPANVASGVFQHNRPEAVIAPGYRLARRGHAQLGAEMSFLATTSPSVHQLGSSYR